MPVKEKRRGRPQKAKGQLSAEAILAQAKTLMVEHHKIPSIRALANSLNVDAMAIYHYFKNKNALQESILVSLIEEIHQPNDDEAWQQALRQLCYSYVSLLHRYQGLLETLLAMETTSPAMVFIERFEHIVEPLQLSSDHQKQALDLLADYLHGFALAMQCQSGNKLSEEMLQGPLNFYLRAIEAHAPR